MRNCNCAERWIERDGKRTPFPDGEHTDHHSCSYTKERNFLIPTATSNVIERVGVNISGGRWTKLFALEMDRLAREAKLI